MLVLRTLLGQTHIFHLDTLVMITKLYLISIIAFIAFSSNVKDINISEVTYDKGLYQLAGRNVTGNLVDYYENEQLKFRYSVIDGRLHGEAWEFYDDGTVKAERNYIFGKLFGPYTVYWPNGDVRLKMSVKNNAYGFGETVEHLHISSKPGKKLREMGAAKLVFYDTAGQVMRSSENLAIEEQFSFKIYKESKEIYANQ